MLTIEIIVLVIILAVNLYFVFNFKNLTVKIEIPEIKVVNGNNNKDVIVPLEDPIYDEKGDLRKEDATATLDDVIEAINKVMYGEGDK